MSYRLDVQLQTRTVCVTHEGSVDLADMESGRAQAVAALTEHGFSRLLVDMRAVEREPSMTEHHRFASTQPLYMPPHIAVAVAVKSAQGARGLPRQAEQLSAERGVQIRAFEDIEEARAWLMRITS
jgi:hypothetical protein